MAEAGGQKSEFYDAVETRDPEARERELFAQLPDAIANAMRAPGWARQLGGIDPKSVRSRQALASLPVLRKSDLKELQHKDPPFAGFAVTPPGKAKRLLMSPGPIFEPEGHGKDWWGAARALHAAGFRAGHVVHNAFAYHLTPGGFILESGAHALGCAVIPGGVGNTEQQVEAIAILSPSGYTGSPPAICPPCSPAVRRAGAPTCASRAGWAARTRPPRSRACSCIPRRSRRSPSAIPSSAGSGSRSPARRSRTR